MPLRGCACAEGGLGTPPVTFFCQKNSWCNPFHKNKKVCVKFADFFKKKKFFYKKLKSKENNLEKTNYNDQINTTFKTKKLLLS